MRTCAWISRIYCKPGRSYDCLFSQLWEEGSSLGLAGQEVCGTRELQVHYGTLWGKGGRNPPQKTLDNDFKPIHTDTEDMVTHTHVYILEHTSMCTNTQYIMEMVDTPNCKFLKSKKKKCVDYHLNILIYNYQDIHIWCQYEL